MSSLYFMRLPWGHTYEPYYPPRTENESGMYRWPSEIVGSLPEGYHYGEYRILQQQYAQPYFSWNVMHYNQYCGKDGDWNWRHEKYPWNSLQWYLSFRWDENLEPEDD